MRKTAPVSAKRRKTVAGFVTPSVYTLSSDVLPNSSRVLIEEVGFNRAVNPTVAPMPAPGS